MDVCLSMQKNQGDVVFGGVGHRSYCNHGLKFGTPNPDKPGLKIDPPAAERLIRRRRSGIAPGLRSLFGGVGSLCLFY